MQTYWVVDQEGYTKPLPNFEELSKDDDPKPRHLPTTLGKSAKTISELRTHQTEIP